MSEEYRSHLKYETLMEDEELASMFDLIPELSPEEEAVVQLINEILDRFDNETPTGQDNGLQGCNLLFDAAG